MTNYFTIDLASKQSSEEIEHFIHYFLSDSFFLAEKLSFRMLRKQLKFTTKKGTELRVSIQAGRGLYSSPSKDNLSYRYYTNVEVGVPSWEFSKECVNDYAESDNTPLNSVYPYIPITIVAKEIYRAIQEL